jgi:hypothetical protein
VELEIKNVGPVLIYPTTGEVRVQLPPIKIDCKDGDPHSHWRQHQTINLNFRSPDDLRIEPGASEKYVRDVIVPAGTKVIQLHAVVYDNGESTYWDETAIHFLLGSDDVRRLD